MQHPIAIILASADRLCTATLAVIPIAILLVTPTFAFDHHLPSKHNQQTSEIEGSPSGPRKRTTALLEKAVAGHKYQIHIKSGDKYSVNMRNKADLNKALYHYKQAAGLGSVVPLMAFARKVADEITRGNDCGIDPFKLSEEYFPVLLSEASDGKRSAQKELGYQYFKGVLVEKNPEYAAKWLKPAAKAGDPSALRALAMVHISLPDVQGSRDKAIKLLKISGQKGNGAAYATLAKLYLAKNQQETYEQAFKMFRKATENGYLNAIEDIQKVFSVETLLGKNQLRIKKLEAMIESLSIRIAGYMPPVSSDGRTYRATEFNQQPLDTIVVGAIPTQNNSLIIQNGDSATCNFTDSLGAHNVRSIIE